MKHPLSAEKLALAVERLTLAKEPQAKKAYPSYYRKVDPALRKKPGRPPTATPESRAAQREKDRLVAVARRRAAGVGPKPKKLSSEERRSRANASNRRRYQEKPGMKEKQAMVNSLRVQKKCNQKWASPHWPRMLTPAENAKEHNRKPKTKERNKRQQLKREYGITPEIHQAMMAKQRGRCAVCGDQKPLHIDHCHKVGRVRELLCNACNSAEGFLRSDPERTRAMLAYVEKWYIAPARRRAPMTIPDFLDTAPARQ